MFTSKDVAGLVLPVDCATNEHGGHQHEPEWKFREYQSNSSHTSDSE